MWCTQDSEQVKEGCNYVLNHGSASKHKEELREGDIFVGGSSQRNMGRSGREGRKAI